ncbi:MAG TPA: hypothetical protein VGQ83_23020 [Polyangia bacterium]
MVRAQWLIPGTLALVLASPARAAADEPRWLLGMEAGYGVRLALDRGPTPAVLASRDDPGQAYSTGLVFGRQIAPGVLVLALLRLPIPAWEGELAAGAGLDVARRLTPALALRGALVGGVKQLFNDACECGGLQYWGPWARAEAGIRYWLLAAHADALPAARARFDLYLALTVGCDAVAARYPDGSQYGRHVVDHGWRLGPDAALGVGFGW